MSQTLPGLMRALIAEVMSDAAQWTPGVRKSNDFKRDLELLRVCDPRVLTHELPRLGKLLDLALAQGREETLKLETDPALSLSPRIFRYWVEGVRRFEPESVRALRQVLHLFAKYPLVDRSLEEQQIMRFLERNDDVGVASLDADLVHRMNLVASRLTAHWDLREIIPRHGPGAVAGREAPWEKFKWKSVYRKTSVYYPEDEYYFLNLNHFLDSYDTWNPTYRDEPTTRLCCVPKDFRGPRLIACEPLEIQWLQQGQARYIMRQIETSRLTRCCVRFSDQTVNQHLALRGSTDPSIATIDLKDASDRVSYNLVRQVLPPQVFQYLDATRSEFTLLPSGERVKLNMMSTMGSANCFPIESLMFFCLLVAEQMRAGFRSLDAEILRVSENKSYAVYGDDLVVPTDKVDSVKAALRSIGLEPNDQKCCTGPRFRESCGMDAYKGHNVTPIRVKSFPDRRAPLSLPSATDCINNLAARGLQQSASWLESQLVHEFGPVLYSVHDMPCSIYTDSVVEALDRNTRLPSRFSRSIQQYLYLSPYCAPVFHWEDVSDWCLAMASINYGLKVDSRGFPVPHRARLIKRWTAI